VSPLLYYACWLLYNSLNLNVLVRVFHHLAFNLFIVFIVYSDILSSLLSNVTSRSDTYNIFMILVKLFIYYFVNII